MRVCVCVSVGLGGSTRQNDIPPFVSTFLRRLHSFGVSGCEGEPGVAEQREEDAGAVCTESVGPVHLLIGQQKVRKRSSAVVITHE